MKKRIYKRFAAALVSATIMFSQVSFAPQPLYAATEVNALNQIRFTMPYGSGDYIITKDITGVTGITISGNVKIDLNGHKITGSSFAGALFAVKSGCTLTISDSKGGGSITNENNQEAVGCYGGTLNITGGSFSGVKYGVRIKDGTLNITGGKIKGESEAIYMQSGTLNMTGGKASTESDTGCALYIADGKAEITGGSFTSSGAYATAITMKKGNTTITGAKLKCSGAHSYGIMAESGSVYISGGKLTANGPLSTGIGIRSGCSVAIANGTILASNRGIVATGSSPDKAAGLDITGGKIKVTGPYGNAVIMNKNVDVNIAAGEFITPCGYPEFVTKKNTTGTWYISKKVLKGTKIVQRYSEDDFSYFSDTGVKYEKDMLITDCHDLYSAINDATSRLCPEIQVRVDSATLEAFNDYSTEWFYGKAVDYDAEVEAYSESPLDYLNPVYSDHTNSLSDETGISDTDSSAETDFAETIDDTNDTADTFNMTDISTLTITPMYSTFYETMMLLQKKAKTKSASADAVEYAGMIKKIIKSSVSSKASDEDKIKAVHDYMVKTYSYDYSNAEDSTYFYGPLENNTAVSTGYSDLFRLFMAALDIESDTVTGYNTQNIGTRILHTWNSVTLDKTVYYIDVTWDDSTDSLDYFLKTEDEFYKDGYHVPLS